MRETVTKALGSVGLLLVCNIGWANTDPGPAMQAAAGAYARELMAPGLAAIQKIKGIGKAPLQGVVYLSKVRIIKKDCKKGQYFVTSIFSKPYTVYPNTINNVRVRTFSALQDFCSKPYIGFQVGDTVNVAGRYIEEKGENIVYQALMLSRNSD